MVLSLAVLRQIFRTAPPFHKSGSDWARVPRFICDDVELKRASFVSGTGFRAFTRNILSGQVISCPA
jgi:hypothetical protein